MELNDDLRSPAQIWQYQIEWQERRVERMGYLFFGAPNDRPRPAGARLASTSSSHFEKPSSRTTTWSDEVFFRLKGWTTLKRHLSSYAAALDLASTASGGAKAIYMSKPRTSCAP